MRIQFLVLLSLLAHPAAAQQPGPPLATRDRLQSELARLDRDAHGKAAASLIRSRLETGDFQAGDRILLRVEGEQQLSDTFTVGIGPSLPLPRLEALPLAGVLRSELQGKLESHLAKYLRQPVVQAWPLIRLLVEGDVQHPGFYAVAPERPLADVITAAGGLTPRAKPTSIRIERDGAKILSGPALVQAIGRGYSVDFLNLRAGDRVLVPAKGDFARTAGIIGALVAVPVAIYSLTRGH